MQKLSLADIRGPQAFAPVREEMRRRVIELKKRRRILVGPQVSLVFENRDTMQFQIEEMCRAEGISDSSKIQDELNVYNAILPDRGGLAATLFIEITSERKLEDSLERLVGLQNHVWLLVGDARIKATFDPEQFETDRLAAVQYLKFPLETNAQAKLRTPGTPVAVLIDHPNYRHQSFFDEASRAELARDLDEA